MAKRYTVVNDDDRIFITTSDNSDPDHKYVEIEFPDDFDFDKQYEYKIIDGELVHDPLPPTQKELYVERQKLVSEQINTAVLLFVRSSAKAFSDEDALSVSELYSDWSSDSVSYEQGDICRYNDSIWRCRSDHTSQTTWNPADAHSLWENIVPPGTIPEWEMTVPGIFDGYDKGQKVTHNGKTWESTFNGKNVWEPGTAGIDERFWIEVSE